MKAFLFNRVTLVSIFVLIVTSVCLAQAKSDSKLTPAEIISKHLESIGSSEARARSHGTKIKGTCELIVKLGGNGQSVGRVLMASQGNQNLINLTFDSGEPSTAFGFDGSKISVTQFRPGRHNLLEQFFAEYEEIIREGLLGGALSESWPLLALQQRNAKVEYVGVKKIDGHQLHAIKYTPRKGLRLKATIFFDAETFRHVRTEYEEMVYSTEQTRIPGGGGGLPSISNQRTAAQRLNVFEEFSDFKPEGGLTLPHAYKFELSVQSQTRPLLVDWTFNLTDFTFNSPLDAKQFAVVGNDAAKDKPN